MTIFDVTTLSKLDLIFRIKRRMNSRIKNLEFHKKILGANAEAQREINFLDKQVSQLDSNPTIRHAHAMANIIKKWRTIEAQSVSLFGVYLKPSNRQRSVDEKALMEQMHETTKKARVAEIRYRLINEIQKRVDAGWYLVFQTLTVNGSNERKVFSKGSPEFSNYIKRVDRAIATTIYGSISKAEKSNEEWHKYFCVVERGKQGRLHMHVLHMCKKLPYGSERDPNYGAKVPYKRCLNNWDKYWSNGFSRPIAVRLTANDAYTKNLNWSWPVKRNENKKIWEPIKAKPCEAVAHYITKYVTKTIDQPIRKDLFRCRMSRKLGMTQITEMINSLSLAAVKQISQMTDNVLLRSLTIKPPPMSLLKYSAKWRLYNNLNLKTLLMIRRETKPLPTFFEQWNTMMSGKPLRKLPNTTPLSTTKLINMAISKQWAWINERKTIKGFIPNGPLRYT